MRTKTWKNIKELIEYPKEGILSKVLVKNNKLDATLFCMSKGSELSEHTSTRQAIIFVVDGEGLFDLEGEKIGMEPGVFISMGKNAVHSLKAKENLSFILSLFE